MFFHVLVRRSLAVGLLAGCMLAASVLLLRLFSLGSTSTGALLQVSSDESCGTSALMQDGHTFSLIYCGNRADDAVRLNLIRFSAIAPGHRASDQVWTQATIYSGNVPVWRGERTTHIFSIGEADQQLEWDIYNGLGRGHIEVDPETNVIEVSLSYQYIGELNQWNESCARLCGATSILATAR